MYRVLAAVQTILTILTHGIVRLPAMASRIVLSHFAGIRLRSIVTRAAGMVGRFATKATSSRPRPGCFRMVYSQPVWSSIEERLHQSLALLTFGGFRRQWAYAWCPARVASASTDSSRRRSVRSEMNTPTWKNCPLSSFVRGDSVPTIGIERPSRNFRSDFKAYESVFLAEDGRDRN